MAGRRQSGRGARGGQLALALGLALAAGGGLGGAWSRWILRQQPGPHARSSRSVNVPYYHKKLGLDTHAPPPLASENFTEAEQSSNKLRVLCFILTQPANHRKKADHVKATWGRRCNVLLFMSSQEDKILPTVSLAVHEGRSFLWSKTRESLIHVHRHHRHAVDWFLKADDDTYVVMENLRLMLSSHNTSEPLYFGHYLRNNNLQGGYMHGGAGYVLSSAALDKFIEVGLREAALCSQNVVGDEDYEMGKCMKNLGVPAITGTDKTNKPLFFPSPLTSYLPDNWLHKFDDSFTGEHCCSKHSISFHYITPPDMYLFELLLYHLRPRYAAAAAAVQRRLLAWRDRHAA